MSKEATLSTNIDSDLKKALALFCKKRADKDLQIIKVTIIKIGHRKEVYE